MPTRDKIHHLIDELTDDELATVTRFLETHRAKSQRGPSLPAIGTLTEYIRAAMQRATVRSLDEEGYWGEIPGLPGVWANAPTESDCLGELQSALEDWILFGLVNRLPVPPLDGIELRADQVA